MTLTVSNGGRRYGALPSKFSVKDLGRPHFFLGTPPPPADYGNLKNYSRPVKNQGQEGSCTGHGWATHQEFLELKYNHHDITLSPAGIYYLERQLEGTLDQGDCGAQIVSGAAVVCKYGVDLLSDEPYSDQSYDKAPTADQLKSALNYKSGAYHRLTTVLDIKNCINSGYTFVLGMSVYESFETSVGGDGIMPMPNHGEALLGGHCMSSGWAYDDTIKCPNASVPGAVLTQNSWGPEWGLEGRVWIPYEYFVDPNGVGDMRISHLGKKWA